MVLAVVGDEPVNDPQRDGCPLLDKLLELRNMFGVREKLGQ